MSDPMDGGFLTVISILLILWVTLWSDGESGSD